MSSDCSIEQVFLSAEQLSPYLKGYRCGANPMGKSRLISGANENVQVVSDLFYELGQCSPEAGNAYYLTRTWDLLCWQPIYLAFIAVYQCRGLPDLGTIVQHVEPTYTSGFYFSNETLLTGEAEWLITQAGRALSQLFTQYRDQMNQWIRIRPGFTRHLFADAILQQIVKYQSIINETCSTGKKGDEMGVLQHAKLWLEACELPLKQLDNLRSDSNTGNLTLVRTSCCLAYKCSGVSLCDDCPRLRS
ncbi:siderophore ferric iron reductase [Vibrio profundum]|uniref:siderophore ferric iron reductase n=1 Tax=Vibrio profundum TaxID=2910247 RepID=UPI003D0B55E9